MAEYLASIFGTEKDKVNCSFYFKIGACRHGEKCSRIHNRPTFSQTILLQNLYQNPKLDIHRIEAMLSVDVSDAEEQQHFDEFFEEIFTELEDKYGEIEEMNVCDNIGEHMIGNVYVKFKREEDAEKAVQAVNNRWFNGQPVYAELSPVTDFREACCRQYEMGECTRGGFCNFMHLKPISYELRRELYNRDHPWRNNLDEKNNSDDVDVAKIIKKTRRQTTKRRRKRKKISSKKNRSSNNGANELFNAKLDATQITNANPQSLCSPITNNVLSIEKILHVAKKRRKRRRKNDLESQILPVAYQRGHCSSSSSNESSSASSSRSYSSRYRLPSPFRDLFLSKRRIANGSSSTTTTTTTTNVVANDVDDNNDKFLLIRESDCGKGGFCNFMHLKPISRELRRRLYGRKRRSSPLRTSGRHGTFGDVVDNRRRSRSRSRESRNDRSVDRELRRRNRY